MGLSQLKDKQLFRQQAYIDGQWLNADTEATLYVTNPASGETIGTVPDMDRLKRSAPSLPLIGHCQHGRKKPPRNVPLSCGVGTSCCSSTSRTSLP